MSIPAAVRNTARSSTITKDATLNRTPAPTFLRFIFEPRPRPINCCTHATTREFYENPSHPYHIKISRRLAAFDRSKFYWSVSASIDVAKKKVVRSWVKRKVEEAVRAELKARGWARDGSVLESAEDTGVVHAKASLRGALKIYMAPDNRKEVITATGDDVRSNVRSILDEVVHRQASGTPDRPMQNNRRKKGQTERPWTPGGSAPSREKSTLGKRTI